MAKILVPAGSTDVPVGKIVAIMVDSKEQALAFKDLSVEEVLKQLGDASSSQSASTASSPAPAVPAPAPATPTPVAATPAPSVLAPQPTSGDRVFASPYAKKVCIRIISPCY